MINLNKTDFIKLTAIYIVLSVVGLSAYNFETLWGPLKKRGFDCSDESLRKPYLEDTISSFNLYIIGVYLPIAIIILWEFITNYIGRKDGIDSPSWFEKFVCKAMITLTTFLFGLAVERLLKNFAKYKMVRLRPHFLAVCEPIDMDGYNCNNIIFTTFMDEYECSTTVFSSDIVNGAYVSFPSGHASLSFYGMVFLASYLQRFQQDHQIIKTPLAIFLPIIQISCVSLAWFVSISRVLDYKHHWSDVLCGLAWGSSVALAMTFYMKNKRANIEKLTASSSKCLAAKMGSQEDICGIELAND